MAKNNIVEFFGQELKVINMGLESFSDDLKRLNISVVQMDWKPPAGGDKKMASLLAMMNND